MFGERFRGASWPMILFVEGWKLLVAIVGAAGLAAYQLLFSRRAKIRRALSSRRRMAVGRIAGGSVVVRGHVRRHSGLLHAPISGRPCVAYEVHLRDSAGKEVIAVRQAAVPFLAADWTGSALVDPGPHMKLALVEDVTGGGTWRPADPEIIQNLQALLPPGTSLTGWLGSTTASRYR
jgi:hypothetical protein